MKTALVTGATRGLGAAIANRLLAEGYKVIATGRRETEDVVRMREAYGEALAFEAFDLAQTDLIADLVKGLVRQHGPIYGLVNNAGIGTDGILGTMHNSDIQRVMTVNSIAPMILTKYLSRSMMLAGEGRIVNVSSIIASTGFSGLAVYAASKASLEGFTRSLARELGRLNITVNALAPGFMQTDMTGSLVGDKLGSILRRSPLQRLATTADAAGAVAYFLGPDGAAVTGTVLTVDAGSTA
ncbi:3-oxoacyl-[acyl-carrier-protein] reductase [Devosia sp. LC5]|uniref:SDR family NAD(P)-dependent oxidoreductase n=1 Tax=Devosia sp. LC5 TaxID=1502724 RepID=UPI0004E46895|nr:SDR family oxidoreductase [Devosia sp. LC5]KFC71186.1 3-oxoacyl-[acyl-carrier-protein] reductase [Devosia sp. LC5]